MATKIRLARHGHKDYAYYHIVVADSRSPRDGKYIERIGSYNPNNNPAKVDLKFDRALYWVNVGAQPTDTVRNILTWRTAVCYYDVVVSVVFVTMTSQTNFCCHLFVLICGLQLHELRVRVNINGMLFSRKSVQRYCFFLILPNF